MASMADRREERKTYPSEVHRRQRRKNLAVLLALVGFCVLVYFVSIARMSGA